MPSTRQSRTTNIQAIKRTKRKKVKNQMKKTEQSISPVPIKSSPSPLFAKATFKFLHKTCNDFSLLIHFPALNHATPFIFTSKFTCLLLKSKPRFFVFPLLIPPLIQFTFILVPLLLLREKTCTEPLEISQFSCNKTTSKPENQRFIFQFGFSTVNSIEMLAFDTERDST